MNLHVTVRRHIWGKLGSNLFPVFMNIITQVLALQFLTIFIITVLIIL